MTQPDDAWIAQMGELLKEHQRAQTMRDAWERKRVAAFEAIEQFRTTGQLPAQETEPVQDPAQA